MVESEGGSPEMVTPMEILDRMMSSMEKRNKFKANSFQRVWELFNVLEKEHKIWFRPEVRRDLEVLLARVQANWGDGFSNASKQELLRIIRIIRDAVSQQIK